MYYYLLFSGDKLFETEAQRLSKSHRRFTEAADISASMGMSKHRFVQIRKVFPLAFANFDQGVEGQDNFDPWWPISTFVDNYNKNRNKTVAASIRKTLDESMSAYRPRASALGGLPNISYIMRKPEPLGTEFKVSPYQLFIIKQ